MQNQSKREITFDTQLKTALFETIVNQSEELPDSGVSFYVPHDFTANVKVKWMMSCLWLGDTVISKITPTQQ